MNDTTTPDRSATPIFDTLVAEAGLRWPGLPDDKDDDVTEPGAAPTRDG